MSATMSDRTERKGTQVVHVRENSDHELEAMFKAALNPNDSPGIPLRLRNLPASFFTPPEPPKQVHSREGSTDSTGYSNPPLNHSGPIHGRTHSSPAMLQQTQLSTLPPPQHTRQRSCDHILDEQPLPPGWEMAKTPQGQIYFLNHVTQKTTWQDPRKANFNVNNMGQSTPPQSQLSPNVSLQNLHTLQQNLQNLQNMPLPHGWEQAITPEGETYFINHIERTTSWFDPRLPMHMQRLQLRSQQTNGPPQPNPQPPGAGAPAGPQALPVHSQPMQMSQPAMHMQRLQLRSQQTNGPPQPNPQPPGAGAPAGPQAVPVHSQPMQMSAPPPQRPGIPSNAPQTALQKLQEEKELLRKRQEEITRQEMALRTSQMNQTVDPTNELTTIQDPFLGQTNSSDLHARQGSTDSGLGGMGNGTSFMPKTPEEFLSNVSEMEAQDGGHRQGDFNTMDMVSMETELTNMDGDDLVPSLQADDINNELLNDVETVLNSNNTAMDNNLLTWL